MFRVLMLLAPHLATFTYASPHLIPHAAVAGAMLNGKAAMTRGSFASGAAAKTNVDDVQQRIARVTPGLLVKQKDKDDAWRVADAAAVGGDAEISPASLSQRTVDSEHIEWAVSAPITFEYRVRECTDVLDPASDALLFGHISDEATLARAKSRELKRVVVVDEQVHALYGERIEGYFAHHGVKTKLLVLPTTEENKNMDMVLTIAEAIHDLGLDRRLDPVIAIGGGVCMDIVGFAASIYRRRTPYIRVPTTLMGYVDASIGAKTGVNFAGHKNKLGAYLPPALTLLDRNFLATLDDRQLANGAAEIAKMALVKDPELYELLADHGEALIANKFQDVPGAYGADKHAPSRVLYLAI